MRDIMVVYAEALAGRNLPPHDDHSARDRERFEDFKSGFVAGIGEALLEVKEARSVRSVDHMIRSALVVHGGTRLPTRGPGDMGTGGKGNSEVTK